MSHTCLRLALFDCDGTLVDSQHAIVEAMDAAFRSAGLPPPDAVTVRRLVGLPLDAAIASLLPDQAPPLRAMVAGRYREAFSAGRQNGALVEPLFPGIAEALSTLADAGVLLGIATGKSRRGLLAMLEQHRLRDAFITLQTSDTGPGKPHPDMVYRALAESGVDAANTVMIGDTTFDILMARSARVASVGVSWGYHDVAELQVAGADCIVHGGGEVAPAVLSLLAV